MRPPGRIAVPILAALLCSGAAEDHAPANRPGRTEDAKPRPGVRRFEMTPAVACSRVDGFENYVPLPQARLTSEDKLKVYFRPLNYRVEPVQMRYRAKFIEDGQIRRKGEKNPLSKEEKLLEYKTTFDSPTYQIFLTNNIGLKNLPPGDYEFEIILHDALAAGATATQSIPFTIIPTPKGEPTPDVEGPVGSEDPAGPAAKDSSKTATPKKRKPPRTPKSR